MRTRALDPQAVASALPQPEYRCHGQRGSRLWQDVWDGAG